MPTLIFLVMYVNFLSNKENKISLYFEIKSMFCFFKYLINIYFFQPKWFLSLENFAHLLILVIYDKRIDSSWQADFVVSNLWVGRAGFPIGLGHYWHRGRQTSLLTVGEPQNQALQIFPLCLLCVFYDLRASLTVSPSRIAYFLC